MRISGLPHKSIIVSIVLAALALGPFWLPAAAARRDAWQSQLQINEPIEMEMLKGARHEFQVRLMAGQFARVAVEQRGIDVTLALLMPGGAPNTVEAPAFILDNTSGAFGTEMILIAARETGDYTVRVQSALTGARAGKYRIELLEIRAALNEDADDEDSTRLTAQRECSEAYQLSLQENAESQQQSLAKYLQALPRWRATGEHGLEIQTLNHIGMVQLDLGEVSRAVEAYREALGLSREKGNRMDEMQSLGNLAEAYQQTGEPRLALTHYTEQLTLIHSAGDFHGEAVTLTRMGGIYISLGEPGRALETFSQAIGICNVRGLTRVKGLALGKQGAVYFALGEYQDALDNFNQALRLHPLEADPVGQITTLNDLGRVHLALGEYTQALEYFEQALELSRKIGNRLLIARTLNNIGQALDGQKNHSEALESFREALNMTRETGARSEEMESLRNIGAALHARGDSEHALVQYRESLDLSRKTGERGREAWNLGDIGTVLAALGQAPAAWDCFEKALTLSRQFGDRTLQASVLYQMARLSHQQGDFAGARKRIEEAIKIVETLRTKLVLQDLRAAYFGTVQNYYRLYIDTLMRISRDAGDEYAAEALRINETARARSLIELIVQAKVRIREGVPKDLIESELELRREIDAKGEQLMQLLTKDENPRLADYIRQEITTATNGLRDVQARILKESPGYAALTQPPRPLSLAEIQRQVLDDDTLLLEYSLGDARSYLWVAGKTAFTSHTLPAGNEIESAARRVSDLLRRRPQGSQAERAAQLHAWQDAARDLSRMLLGPIAGRLRNQKLMVVSDGALQYIPFGALPLPVDGNTPRRFAPLLTNHQVISLSSATTLAILRQEFAHRKPADGILAVLADPVFGKYDDRVAASLARTPEKSVTATAKPLNPPVNPKTSDEQQERSAVFTMDPRNSDAEAEGAGKKSKRMEQRAGKGGTNGDGASQNNARIARLAFSRDEAEAILRLAPPGPTLSALDFAASLDLARNPVLGEYRILHFATHGLIDSQHSDLSGLVFSTVDKTGAQQNGLLHVGEIFNLKLPAELVVLSACQSGLGRDIKGEGINTLTRAFMHAGARRVVASLWKVNDAATAELMERFYKGMFGEQKLSPSAALRQAQISMWKETKWQSPYFWAPFVLQGEW